MVLLKPNYDLVDGDYLLFVLMSRGVQTQIMWSEGTGSTVSNLRIPHLCALSIPCLPIEKQRAIGRLLASLDEKI
jgi:type I restriction enzyme S subunit